MPAAIMALGAPRHPPASCSTEAPSPPANSPSPTGTVKEITILQVFEGMGSTRLEKSMMPKLEALEAAACPGPGACGGQFTANTMAMAGEFLGISPINLTGVPAMSPRQSRRLPRSR